MRFDQLVRKEDRPWWELLAERWTDLWTDRLPTWKMGYKWHLRFHDRLSLEAIQWAKSIKVGDIVCDCSAHHLRVVKKLDWDTVELENGHNADLISCCSPVKEDNSCHSWQEEDLSDV